MLDPKIKQLSILAYLNQSLLSGLFMLTYLLVWNQFIPMTHQFLFSSIASSTFLTFLSTQIYNELSTKIIGGQLIGVAIGFLLWHGLHATNGLFSLNKNEWLAIFIALSVMLCLFVMTILDYEHPPASGTAMALVALPHSPKISDLCFVILAAVCLAGIHYILKKRQLIKDIL